MVKQGESNSSIEPSKNEHKFPPAVGFMSLLDELRLDPQKSILSFGALQFYFLPRKDAKGNDINYSPSTDNPSKVPLHANLINEESNATITKFYFELNSLQPIVSQGVLFTNGKLETEVKVEPGKYRLDFYLGKTLFQKYNFHVLKTPVNDAYSSIMALYTIGGEWEKYALLQIDEDDQRGEYTLRFQPIINYHGIHTQSGSQYLRPYGEAQMMCVLKQNGKIIGSYELTENTNSDDIFGEKYVPAFDRYKLKTDRIFYNQSSIRFYKVPKTTSGQDHWVQMKQLTDGSYAIELSMKEMADREDFTQIFAFEVKNGKVVQAAQANRSLNSDLTTFFETGRDFILIESN